MCDNDWFTCETLARGNEFKWKYDESGGMDVRSNNIYTSFSSDIINMVIDHVYDIKNGVPLGSSATGNVSQYSVGSIIQEEIQNFNRPYATYLAAILVYEGICNFENLGRGPGRGLWLYPVSNEISKIGSVTENKIIVQQENSIYKDIFQQISNNLNNLSGRVKTTEVKEIKSYKIKYSELNINYLTRIRIELRNWEAENPSSLYIYKYKSMNINMDDLKHINDDYVSSREKNIKKRAFARVNKNNAESHFLYVGSSRSIGQRTKDHFGFSSKGVYSLQIIYWSQNLPEDFEFELEILRFSSDTDYENIQVIEDGLWNIYQPMFGRQGQR